MNHGIIEILQIVLSVVFQQYLIPFFSYYISLILTNSRFETNSVIKINKDTEEEKKNVG